MTKRTFFKSLGAVLVAIPAGVRGLAAGVPREVWGPVDVMRYFRLAEKGIHLHVYRFNQDVTRHCRFFDDTPGRERAELYLRNEQGQAYLNDDKSGPAVEIITNFVIRRGAPLS